MRPTLIIAGTLFAFSLALAAPAPDAKFDPIDLKDKYNHKLKGPLAYREKLVASKKHSRNAPCPCGSGKKYKHCCFGKEDDLDLGSGRQPPQYPIGTVVLYGPDDKKTTKIAAGVILHVGAEAIIERWVATDVTTNPKVQQEMKDFFLQHGVKSVAMSEGNMGCPHEEGEDFPHGEDCPFCPFWKGKQGSNKKD
jgi:hypothetical protein